MTEIERKKLYLMYHFFPPSTPYIRNIIKYQWGDSNPPSELKFKFSCPIPECCAKHVTCSCTSQTGSETCVYKQLHSTRKLQS